MSKRMSKTTVNGFNSNHKVNSSIDFYSAFINLINNNEEKIINKKDCIEKLEKIKEEKVTALNSNRKVSPSFLERNKIYHRKDKVLRFIQAEKEEQQKEITKIVNEQREKNEKIYGNEQQNTENNVKPHDVNSPNESTFFYITKYSQRNSFCC